MTFPIVGKGPTEWPLTAGKLAEYAATFPDLDVASECRKARQWVVDTPARRKTAAGMPKFLGGWLGRAQNAGKSTRPAAGPDRHSGPPKSATQARIDEVFAGVKIVPEESARG